MPDRFRVRVGDRDIELSNLDKALYPAMGFTKGEIIKALFELTKAVETVKKQVMRLEKRDDSALL